MTIDFLLQVFRENRSSEAVIWQGQSYSYQWLEERTEYWQKRLVDEEVNEGAIAVIEGDFSPNAIALFLALLGHRCILVPLTSSVAAKRPRFLEIAQAEILFAIDEGDGVVLEKLEQQATHEFYEALRERKHPGLVLFSSGSTGESKAAVHDMMGILEKFKVQRHALRSITFLLYDHIGGVNTMLYNLSNAGCIVTVQERTPDTVLEAVEKYGVELLPTSPTFINLVLFSEAYKRHDLSSVKTITYGTEPMPESTLKRFNELFPDIRLLQTYGLSEVGILRSKSKSSDSLWVKVGGEGFETRVVDGILQIKAVSAMLGYLNAPSPFTEDGWFHTGDAVRVDGEYLQILGRKSEIINVGGEKVYPAEVESILQELSNVSEATVYGEKNPLVGNIVCANIRLGAVEPRKEFTARMKKHCKSLLESYKIPVKVRLVDTEQHTARFKKNRSDL